MISVIKRDGEIAEFHLSKITSAITKAFKATGTGFSNEILELLALRVTADFQEKMEDGSISVEQIQDSVEHVLEQTGYTEVAKAYILYRKQRERIRNMNTTILDYRDVVDRYVRGGERREEDPPVYSVGGLILSNSGAVTEQYWLSEIYDSGIADAHRNGQIHIQDLSMLTGHTCSWSLEQLLREGLGGVEGMVACAPARHLAALCNQMVNFLGIMQNEWAGAQSFGSFDTYLAPFVKADRMGDEELKSCMESFVYGINIPSRWGTQALCVHIGLDGTVPDRLRTVPAIAGGRDLDFCYGDCQPELDRIGQALRQVLKAGDAAGRSFPYPVVELGVGKMPENTGSIGTVAVSLKAGELSREELAGRLELAARALQVKRRVLNAFLQNGLYPYTWRYLGTLKNHRSVILLTGADDLEPAEKEALCSWARACLEERQAGEIKYLEIEIEAGMGQ